MARKKPKFRGPARRLPLQARQAITLTINKSPTGMVTGFTLTGNRNGLAESFCATFPDDFKSGRATVTFEDKSVIFTDGPVMHSVPVDDADLLQMSYLIKSKGAFKDHRHTIKRIEGPSVHGFTLTAVPPGEQ